MSDSNQNCIVVMVTVGSENEGKTIASTLIEERLAACVTSFPVNSTYRWLEEVQCDQEWQLMIKTQQHQFERLEARIQVLHSYDVPEIIALPIVQGHQPYLTWMEQESTQTLT